MNFTFNKGRLALSCLVPVLALAASTAAHAGDIQLNFSGTVSLSACVVEMGSKNQTVDFKSLKVYNASVSKGKVLVEKPFTIKLKDCDYISTASVSMSGTADKTNPDYFALDPSPDSASGVALRITSASGDIQKPSNNAVVWNFNPSETEQQLDYKAALIKTADISTGKIVVTAEFSITYR